MSTKRTQGYITRLLFLALVVCGASPLLADSGDPSARVARLGSIEGTVSVQPSGVDQWNQAATNYPIATGDRLYADKDGRDEISIGGTVVRMWHDTDLTMTSLSDQLTQLGLAQGTVRVRTFGIDPNQQVEIDTPNGAITITQPGDIRIDSYQGDGGTQVTVNTGAVQVSGPNLSQAIGQGESVRLMGTNPIDLQQIAMPGLDPFDQWSVERDRHMENARSAQYVSRETPGYDDLDDYGSWDAATEYGPVWYPREVPADWAPYREGHWVWTGPWGWTWVDDEPWGYAPFHYGRWSYIGSRWGWVPGPIAVRPYWSPALVAFVGGGGFSIGIGGIGLAAWFPLGVGEPYIPWYHCSPEYIRQVNVTNINIVNIHNTTIVNNYNTFVRNSNNFTDIHAVNYNYSNRERAFTAVNGRAFASGQPVARNIARVSPEQIRGAQLIAHPSIQPTHQSIVPRPVTRALPVSAQRPTLLTRGGREAQAVPGARAQAVPYHALPANTARGATPTNTPTNRPGAVQSTNAGPALANHPAAGPTNRPGSAPANHPAAGPVNGPPAQGYRSNAPGEANSGARPLITRNGGTTYAGRPAPGAVNGAEPRVNTPPSANQRSSAPPLAGAPAQRTPAANPQGYQRPNAASPQPRPLVTRNEPPGNQPTFQQQQGGFKHDPGRPLDPQQRQNINMGRPAGRSQDPEYLPHAQPAPQQHYSAPAPQQQRYSAPAPQQQHYSAPPQQQHYSAPPQQQHYSAPPQQQHYSAPQQQHYSAPPQQHSAAPREQSAPRSEPRGGNDERHPR